MTASINNTHGVSKVIAEEENGCTTKLIVSTVRIYFSKVLCMHTVVVSLQHDEKKHKMSEKKQNKNVNLLKLRWDQRRVKPRRVLSDRTCDWCLQASQSALCSGKSSYMTWISLHVRCHKVGSVQMCSYCKIGAPPRRTICAVTTAPLSF